MSAFRYFFFLLIFLLNSIVSAEEIVFRIWLNDVERSTKASYIYGHYSLEQVKVSVGAVWIFEDDNVKIGWVPDKQLNGMNFWLFNKTDYTITIRWEEGSFVDENGQNHRIIHSGVKYIDRNLPQPPSIIVKKKTLDDIVIPSDYVYWEEILRGNWKVRPFFIPRGKTKEEVILNARTNIGKTFQILLPFEINNAIHEYLFIFKIYDVMVTNKEKKQSPIIKEFVILDSYLWIKANKTTCRELIDKYGQPILKDEDSVSYNANSHPDFKGYKSIKFMFNEKGIITDIRLEQ